MTGQKVKVLNSPELITDVLMLSANGTLLRYKKDQDVSALTKKDASATSVDMILPQAVFPTRVYHQFFHIANKRANKRRAGYTTPNHAVASSLSWAFAQTLCCIPSLREIHLAVPTSSLFRKFLFISLSLSDKELGI